MDQQPAGEEDLERALRGYVEQHSDGSNETRARLMEIALTLHARRLPTHFILASIRSTAALLAETEHEGAHDEAMRRPAVREFIEANVTVPGNGGEVDTRRDVKNTERERLRQSLIAAVRDARRSKARHEIKKTRSVLMKIDQRHVRRTLGREGDELCHEINRILRATAAMF